MTSIKVYHLWSTSYVKQTQTSDNLWFLHLILKGAGVYIRIGVNFAVISKVAVNSVSMVAGGKQWSFLN